MAMVLSEFIETRRNLSYSVLATDLSTDMIKTARSGIYSQEIMAPVPWAMQRKYVLTAKQVGRRDMRVSPHLRSKVGFARMNLMDREYPVGDQMHIIFCRNVLIYFDKETKANVLTRLCACLAKGGYLFIGHSESIAGIKLPLKQVANTIFQKA